MALRVDPHDAASARPWSLRAGLGVAIQGACAALRSDDPWIAASQALLAVTGEAGEEVGAEGLWY